MAGYATMSDAPRTTPGVGPLDDTGLEQSLLGLLLVSPRFVEALPSSFSPDHYIHPPHAMIHTAIIERADPDNFAMTYVAEALRGVPGCEPAYIAELATAAPSPTVETARGLAERVTDRHRRRRAIAIADQLKADAVKGDAMAPAGPFIFRAIEQLDQLGQAAQARRPGQSFDEAMDAALAHADAVAAGTHPSGLLVGMQGVDDVLLGLEPKTIMYVASRPGVGKSSLIMPWAIHGARQLRDEAAQTGEPPAGVLIISLEMKNMAVARRILSKESGVPNELLRRGRHETQAPLLIRARRDLNGLPIWMEDASNQTVPMIRNKARQAARRFGGRIGLIVIDHLHIVKAEDKHLAGKNETWAVGSISRSMKDLADEFDCPLIAAAQLNRGLEDRPFEEQRPTKRDLRGSGAIEEDADVIVGLNRPELSLPKDEPERSSFRTQQDWLDAVDAYRHKVERWRGKAELIPLKVRDGSSDRIVQLNWNAPTTSYTEQYA